MSDAERAIVKVADLVSANASNERIADSIRAAKRAIGSAVGLTDENDK